MRIAFLSDIHGNYTAFQAVLKDLEAQKIDQFVSLGDTITMGPQPVETLRALRNLGCLYVKGNHDDAVLEPEKAEQYEVTHYLIPDLHWCQRQLSADDLAFLASFKPMISLALPNGIKILAYHGSPLSSTDIIQATTNSELLDKYFEGQNADIYIGGHSHIQMTRRYGKKVILNSGSIGNAFEFVYAPGNKPKLLPWAEYMIVSQSDDFFSVDARRVYFDTDEVHKIVKESSLPGSAWWLRQYDK
ncbi:MAG: metallophosphoesterase family protein [Anaerolineales bacterium]|nr:metallophosphoesterase family protein [Anaerolineales bacterium]